MQHYADAKWKDTYVHHLDYDNFTFHLARVFTILYKQFKAHRGKQEDDDRKHITITVISHGGIDVDTNIPCSFYYMNDAMKRVTLYEPWGCAIDASVVYGITTNTIQIPHVRYSGRVRPSEPNTWNNLPRCTSPTPNITLTPVKIGEPAYRRLCRLFQVLQGKSDGLVIPYFTGEDQDLLPFPAIPFWVMCCVFALIAAMTRTEVKVRLAACLTVDNVFKVTGHVPCSQYCTVNGSRQPPVMMTSNLALPEELRARLESKLDLLDQYL